MTAEATFKHDHGTVQFTAAAALASGQLCTLPDGRVGVIAGLKAVESGDPAAARTNGVHTVAKASGVAMLAGQRAFFVPASNVVSYEAAGRIYAGIVTKDATMAQTTVDVDLNAYHRPQIDFPDGRQNTWDTTAILGLGTVITFDAPPYAILAFDAVAEAAKAVLLAGQSIALASKPRMEASLAVYGIGDNAALDINVGLASGSHDTDFETVAEFVAIHFDSPGLSILAHSDDGTTDVAAVDSTLDAVDDTFFHLMIDASDLSACKVYIHGVRILDGTTGADTTLTLAAATGPLFPIVHLEKTSDDTVADVRVRTLRAWSHAG